MQMNKPKIRFEGYTEAWEQRKLSEIADKVSEKNKNNEYNEPLTNSAEQGIISQKDYFDREVVNEDNLDGYYIVRDNDFVYNPRVSVSAPVGPINRNRLGRNGVMSPLYTVFRTHDIDTMYLEYYYKTTKWHRFMKLNGDSGARFDRFTISSTLFMEMPIPYPSIEEQEKIGVYFDNLDSLITLHQRKCEQTKKLKKYMLQKMFPQNGELYPEIRFEGFTEAWEQRKFSEFVKNVAKKNKDNLDLEPYAVTNDRGFIAQKDAHDDFGYMKDTDRRAYNIVPPNSFAYNPARINVGSLGYYTGSENVIVSSLYEVFQTEDYIDDRFLWHWLKSDHFPKWIERLQEGSVRLYFYFDKLVQCQMMVPTIKEQNQISAYFDSIDNLITLHQHKCEELQNIKKFMLQNMFTK